MVEKEIAGLTIIVAVIVLIIPSPVLKTSSSPESSNDIAPESFVFSTYLGGTAKSWCYQIAIDSAGNSYITGRTWMPGGFPTLNAFQATYGGGYTDAFVAKFSPSGTLLYSTYLGGSQTDLAYDLAIDAAGNCYVTGFTHSQDFPVQNAYQPTHAGGTVDTFIAKFAPNGSLLFSTFLGGGNNTVYGPSEADDYGHSITVDNAGNIYVTGKTVSTDFPLLNAHDTTLDNGDADTFVTKLNATGNGLLFSTFLGEEGNQEGREIALDSSENIYIAGKIWGTGWFLSKFASNGTLLFYNGLLGDAVLERSFCKGIAIDVEDNIYATGNIGIGSESEREADLFISKFAPNGSLLFNSSLSGSGDDWGEGIAVDAAGNIYITGLTDSDDFPTLNTCQSAQIGGSDLFVSKFTPNGSLLFSTFLGGSGYDRSYSIVVDGANNIYVTGETQSDDFPTVNAHQNHRRGEHDLFVAVLKPEIKCTSIPPSTISTTTNDGPGWKLFIFFSSVFILVMFRRLKNVPETRNSSGRIS